MAGRDPAASAEVPAPQGYGRARSPDVCPHLRSLEGPWRVQHASRDHRCALLARDARLATSHQKAYCLTPAHRTCPINVPLADQASRRHVATAPVLVEHGVAAAAPVIRDAARGGARLARGLLIALLVAGAGLAFLLARGPLAPNPAAQPTGAAGSAGASIRSMSSDARNLDGCRDDPHAGAIDTHSHAQATPARASPRPSASTVAPSRSPAAHTYIVQKGDTLYVIARKSGTTVAVLERLNNITDPTRIRVGQVLRLP